MATITEAWVCEDCLFVIANDDASGIDSDERAAAVRHAVYGTPGRSWSVDGARDTEDGEEPESAYVNEFSYRRCACCRTGLAGSRHRCAVTEA
jgi:hypothetical protein